MWNEITNYLKKYPFTLILIVVIWYLSLFTPPETPLDDVKFIDKWTHLVMYGVLTATFWTEVLRQKNKKITTRKRVLMVVLPIAMGGLVELAQAYCTTNRTGDWFDFLANTVGVLIGIVIVMLWRKCF